MNERPPTQSYPDHPNQDPRPTPPTPTPDPCDDPAPPPKPQPCPEPPKTPCPEPPPCPDPPTKPCPPPKPDPCAEPPSGGEKPPGEKPYPKPEEKPYPKPEEPSYPKPEEPSYPKPEEPTYPKPGETPSPKPGETPSPKPGEKPTPKPGGCEQVAGGGAAAEQLKGFEADLKAAKDKILELEQSKSRAAALEQQIQALKDTIKARQAGNDAYRDFYNTTQIQAREAGRYIETVRCQLKIPNKACVEDVIKEGKKRVDDARDARDAQQTKVIDLDLQHARAVFELEHAKRIYDFFKSGLQDQIKKQIADLTKLKGLADPTKDHCEAEFHLTEMEWHLRSEHCRPDTSQECYKPELRLGTFLDCWGPDCYCTAYDRALVDYNTAVVAEKDLKTKLEQEKTTLKEREETLKKLQDKRREWVLNELKVRGCCKPKDKGPAAV
jgi:hypothetical protein